MERKIIKLLIGFFAVMIAFTIISRAAASAVVTKVQVATVKKGNLTYEVSGTGIIKANAHKYIDLISGNSIGKVSMKEGQQVKKGDLLFTYELKQLKEKEISLEGELQKLKLQYQNVGLSNSAANNTTDGNSVEQTIKNAKEDIKAANLKLADKKKQVKKNKKEEYKKAAAELDSIKTSKEEAEQKAERAVLDAENELYKLMQPENKIIELIDAFKTKIESREGSQLEYDAIFKFLHDDKYEEYKQKVRDAQKTLARAKADQELINQKWGNIVIKSNPYDEDEVKNAYYEQLDTEKKELANAQRVVDDAQESLDQLTKKDKQLSSILSDYQTAIENNNAIGIQNSYMGLVIALSENRTAKTSDVTDAQTKLSRAMEDQTQISEDWAKKLTDAAKKEDELNNDLHAIEDGTYDYRQDTISEEQALTDSNRALTTAVFQQKQFAAGKQISEENNKKQAEMEENERGILEVDINKAQTDLDKIRILIANKGKITAPIDGVISDNDLEQGMTLTGEEKLVITTGGYELYMTADKDDMQYFTVGDEIEVKSISDENKITSQLENVELPDQDGKVNFTAILPEGDYKIGGSLNFDLKKESKQYAMCIPIQALRQDSNSTFVLLSKEAAGVLGKTQEAFRLDVKVLSMDAKSAAIDASISEEDNIITGSNRNFSEGDRVRIYEME